MRRKKRISKTNPKEDKILLIVENSEADFFNNYLKSFLEQKYNIKIEAQKSGSGNKCEIKNFSKMRRKIEEAINDGYKACFLMIDLATQCFGSEFNYNCLIELKRDYQPKYKIKENLKEKFYLFIVCQEIENWYLTADKNIRGITDKIRNPKEKLAKFLDSDIDEKFFTKKMIYNLNNGTYKLDINKNDSLKYFIEKLQEFNQKEKIC